MANFKTFSVGCCCCPTIGIDSDLGNYDLLVQCCEGSIVISNLSDDISLIEQCDGVCCGPAHSCKDEITFTADQYGDIASWVADGGRLYVAGEYATGCYSVTEVAKVNTFMSGVMGRFSFGQEWAL